MSLDPYSRARWKRNISEALIIQVLPERIKMEKHNWDNLDPGIVDSVKVLNKFGIETFESCEGGEGHSYPEPTIRFHGDRSEGFRALAILIQHDLPVMALRRIWVITDGEPSGPFWEVVFKSPQVGKDGHFHFSKTKLKDTNYSEKLKTFCNDIPEFKKRFWHILAELQLFHDAVDRISEKEKCEAIDDAINFLGCDVQTTMTLLEMSLPKLINVLEEILDTAKGMPQINSAWLINKINECYK